MHGSLAKEQFIDHVLAEYEETNTVIERQEAARDLIWLAKFLCIKPELIEGQYVWTEPGVFSLFNYKMLRVGDFYNVHVSETTKVLKRTKSLWLSVKDRKQLVEIMKEYEPG